MNRCAIPCEKSLRRGEIMVLDGEPGGVQVTCRSGRVWVTQPGDRRDLIVQCGEQKRTAGRGLVLIESLEPSVVQIT